MRVENKEDYIRGSVRVTRSMVIEAKRFLLSQGAGHTETIIRQFLDIKGVPFPQQVNVNEQVDYVPALDACASAISWSLACCEGLWELIHANLLIQRGNQMEGQIGSIAWTTIMPGSGGSSSGWSFSDLSIPIPAATIRPPSLRTRADQPLADPDLYLSHLSEAQLSEGVARCLTEAVRCFRAELYTPCVAMICKAAEGAWMELGQALTSALPTKSSQLAKRTRTTLEDPDLGLTRKAGAVVSLISRRDLAPMIKSSRLALEDIRSAAVWSDTLREAAGALHYGVMPAIPNNYEKVAALLLGAAPHLKVMSSLKQAAVAWSSSPEN